jgi:hypothetical protein
MTWAPFKGYGTTLTCNAFSGSITGIAIDGIQRASVDVTSFNSANSTKEFIPGIPDSGSLKVDFLFDPTVGPIAVGGNEQQCVVTFSDSGAAVWTFNAIVSDMSVSVPMEDKAAGSFSMKITGNIVAT